MFESATVAASGVPSTRSNALPVDHRAADLTLVRERIEQRTGHRVDECDAVRSTVLRIGVDAEVRPGGERTR